MGEHVAGARELLAEARRVSEGKYNIMVVKADHEYDMTGISPYIYQTQEHEAGGVRYKIFAFTQGTFVLQGDQSDGDGGFINWAFWGNSTRNGNSVHFKPL